MEPTRAVEQASGRAWAWLYQHEIAPAWERLRGRATERYRALVERTQWWSPEEIAQFQLTELKRLLAAAGERVPYYRELFARERFDPRAVEKREDLAALPPLTRDLLRERYQDLLDPATRGANLRKGTTGSTGKPVDFEYSLDSESWRHAMRLRAYGWAGYRVGAPTFFFWSSHAEHGIAALKLQAGRMLRRETWVDPMVHDEQAMRRAVDELRRARPRAILGYTQALALLARWIEERGLRDWDDIPVLCGAEAVLPGDRAVLGRVFGPGIFETYGCREVMLVAAECEAHDGLHVSEENVLVEVGPEGDVLVTDLHNEAMPLIRYANGDLAAFGDGKPCACGRGLRRLARVDGRRADTLRDKLGRPVPGLIFHFVLVAAAELVKQFQAVQRRDGTVVVRVVRGPRFTDEGMAEIVRRLDEALCGQPIQVEYLDDIPPAPSGKHRVVIVEQ